MFICSPFRGEETKNTKLARRYARYAYDRGCLPVAPHLYFPQFLNEHDPIERNTGIKCGIALMQLCQEVWVFGANISSGMSEEISEATCCGILVRYFRWGGGEIKEGSSTNE